MRINSSDVTPSAGSHREWWFWRLFTTPQNSAQFWGCQRAIQHAPVRGNSMALFFPLRTMANCYLVVNFKLPLNKRCVTSQDAFQKRHAPHRWVDVYVTNETSCSESRTSYSTHNCFQIYPTSKKPLLTSILIDPVAFLKGSSWTGSYEIWMEVTNKKKVLYDA